MKTASVAELRNDFHRLSTWLENGETVEIRKRGKVVAHLVPALESSDFARIPKPDIMARLRKMWGTRVLTDKQVQEMRAAELEGEEG